MTSTVPGPVRVGAASRPVSSTRSPKTDGHPVEIYIYPTPQGLAPQGLAPQHHVHTRRALLWIVAAHRA